MLIVRNLRAGYKHFEIKANFSVKEGSFVAILGPSGSGKTTLVNAIAGFVPLETGSIEWKDENIAILPIGDRPVSILFQEHNLFPHLTIEKNVSIGLKPNLKLTSSERDKVLRTLRRVGLEKFVKYKPAELSGGQRTRVALARAMLRSKPLLLLDEAFSGLGPALRLEMLALIMDFVEQENMTLLMVTHDINDAIKLNQQIIFANDGEIAGPMDLTKFLNSNEQNFRGYLGSGKKEI